MFSCRTNLQLAKKFICINLKRFNNNKSFRSYDMGQLNAMKEEIIKVDLKDKVLGPASKKSCHLLEVGPNLHRAFSVFLFNSKNELLMHRRSKKKITFPGYYTNSCCSHPLYIKHELDGVEGVKLAAIRRINFELGIKFSQVSKNDLHYITRIHYAADYNHVWGEDEIDYILFMKKDVDLNINSDEISEIEYVRKGEMKQFMDDCRRSGKPLTRWFEIIAENYLDTWWDNVDNIYDLRDDKIHRHLDHLD